MLYAHDPSSTVQQGGATCTNIWLTWTKSTCAYVVASHVQSVTIHVALPWLTELTRCSYLHSTLSCTVSCSMASSCVKAAKSFLGATFSGPAQFESQAGLDLVSFEHHSIPKPLPNIIASLKMDFACHNMQGGFACRMRSTWLVHFAVMRYVCGSR